jgi:hypothetical protein
MYRYLMVVFLATLCSNSATGQGTGGQGTWDKIDVMKRAAIEIRALQKSQGNSKALADIDECYGRVMRPSVSYNPAVEACLTKDFVISTTTFAYYMQQSQPEKAKPIIEGMRRRIAATFIFFGLQNEAPAYGKLLVDNVARMVD